MDRRKRRNHERAAQRGLRGVVPEIAVTALLQARPGLASESRSDREGLALICWIATSKRRQHREDASATWLRSLELDARFGRGKFRHLNERHLIFEASAQWSKDAARGYRMLPDVRATFRAALASFALRSDEATNLIRHDGRIARKAHSRIISPEPKGSTILLNPTPIDMEALRQLDGILNEAQLAVGPRPADLLASLELESEKDLELLRDSLHRILIAARTTLGKYGHIPHDYRPCETGRLFAQDVTLQSVYRIIKKAALRGRHEYDFSNCHLAIFEQLAGRQGVSCETVRHYLQEKKAVRNSLAKRIGVTQDEIKECLITLAYGARRSVRPIDAIPQIIGVERAKRLYADPFVADLIRDLQEGRKAILHALPVSRKRVFNAVGLPISSKASPAKRMAHVLQGIETQALLVIVRAHREDILLLQHDGFVTARALNVDEMERTVREATGFELRLEGGPISLPSVLDSQHLHAA